MTLHITDLFLPVMSVVYIASEVYRGISLRGKTKDTAIKDKGSERTLWITIIVAMFAAGFIQHFRLLDISYLYPYLSYAGLFIFVCGYLVRFIAIKQLDKFFTVNVQIQSTHRLIESGLYGHMRHPSYTGALLMFLGIGLCYYDIVSLLVIMIPISIAFFYRIKVEENALISAFGEKYHEYAGRVKRLIPYIY